MMLAGRGADFHDVQHPLGPPGGVLDQGGADHAAGIFTIGEGDDEVAPIQVGPVHHRHENRVVDR